MSEFPDGQFFLWKTESWPKVKISSVGTIRSKWKRRRCSNKNVNIRNVRKLLRHAAPPSTVHTTSMVLSIKTWDAKFCNKKSAAVSYICTNDGLVLSMWICRPLENLMCRMCARQVEGRKHLAAHTNFRGLLRLPLYSALPQLLKDLPLLLPVSLRTIVRISSQSLPFLRTTRGRWFRQIRQQNFMVILTSSVTKLSEFGSVRPTTQ